MRLKVLIDASKTYDSVLEKFEKWVDIENRLLELDESGCIYEQIAEDLPARSMGSVRAKLQRLKREDCEDTYIGEGGVRAQRRRRKPSRSRTSSLSRCWMSIVGFGRLCPISFLGKIVAGIVFHSLSSLSILNIS